VKFDLVKYRSFGAGIVVVTALGFILYGSLVLLPLFMQQLLGWTAATAGLWTCPRGIGAALCMPLVGYLLGRRWDGRWMLIFGLVFAGVAFFGYSQMSLSSGPWDIFWPQIEQGISMAFIFVPLTTITMNPIPIEDIGYATSLYSVMRNIGSSMGISFVTTWDARRSQFHQSRLSAHISFFNPHTQQILEQTRARFMQRGADSAVAMQQSFDALYGQLQRQAALLSFVDVFYLLGFLFLAMIPFVLLMRRPKLGEPTPTSLE